MRATPPMNIFSMYWRSLIQARSLSTRRLGESLIKATRNGHPEQGQSVRRCISADSMTNRACTAWRRANEKGGNRLLVARAPTRRTLHKSKHIHNNRPATTTTRPQHRRHKNGAACVRPQQQTKTCAAPNVSYLTTTTSSTAATTAAAAESDPLRNVTQRQKLRSLFITGAIPMVGFGFMDNFVMIQAGQYIDSTIGVQLGLATMTAAACGQVVSDVSGVLVGGTLERTVGRFKYFRKHAQISQAARQTVPWAKNVTLAGAVVGVICGCAMGASTLLLVDLEARDRIHHATQLRDIVTDMLRIGAEEHSLANSSCTVYVASKGEYTLSKSKDQRPVRLAFLNDGECEAVRLCAQRREVLVQRDCLCAPILRGDDVVAVLEFHLPSQADRFAPEHVKAAKLMAHHLGIVMKHLVEA